MHHDLQGDLLALSMILLGSFLMPLLSNRVKIPSAVLLILYGILVGPNVLDLTPDSEVIGFMVEIGFIVLMFLAGMEIDFAHIRAEGKRALGLMFIICLAIFGLAFVASTLLSLPPIFGLALGATSVGLPLAVLTETGQLRTPLGRLVVLIGSVGEFITLIAMTLFYFSTRYGISFELAWGLAKFLLMLLAAGLVLRAILAMAWWHPSLFLRMGQERESSEIGVRAALLLMVVFAAMAVMAGIESILGAFVAGALIAFVLRGKEVLEHKLTVVGHGLFVPAFFVIVGMRFNPAVISGPSLVIAGKLLVAMFAVRLVPCLVMLWRGLRLRQVVSLASLLSAPLTLVVAIGALGLDIKAIDADGQATLIILAIGTGLVFPVLFRFLVTAKKAKEQAASG